MKSNGYLYVWCVMADDGFYMEPDVSIEKIFFKRKDALLYIKNHERRYHRLFIVKKRVDLI